MEILRQKILKERGIQRFSVQSPKANVKDTLYAAYAALMEAGKVEAQVSESNMSRLHSVSSWLQGKGKPSLLLYGSYGSGKTTMMSAIGYTLDALGFGYISTTAKAITKSDDLVIYRKSLVLLIDEFGREQVVRKDYGNESEPLIDVLLYRYERGLPTVLATNLLDDELADKYGAYFHDRLSGGYERIYYDEKSFRRPEL